MNQDITFHRILDILENFQKNSPMLNTFAYGNLIDFGQQHISGGTVNYPFMFAVPQSVEYQENITVYQFNLIFADILNVSLDNEKDIISNMSLEVRRFLSFVKYGINTYPELFDNIDITLPTVGYPFWERFADHVGGIALDCQITVFEPLDACDWFPTPTATPAPTTTPTGTPVLSPSATPAVTPTQTMTPSATCGLTTQYLKEEIQGGSSIKLSLFVDAGFTTAANATCDLGVSGTYDISGGATGVSFTTAISNAEHTLVFNTGSSISGFTISNINTIGCTCPTDIKICRTYNITGLSFGGTFNWFDCDGTTQTSGNITTTQTICAMQDTVNLIAGTGTITEVGDCKII
jgi:hypothetical protein